MDANAPQYQFIVVDDLSPEDVAMVQALYSRSPESALTHLQKVKEVGSGKFMSSFYVGYGHKSIADCGSTTLFIENVSILAAKAIQDWPLYCGQETSTRYLDMSTRYVSHPYAGGAAQGIINNWMNFYKDNQDRVAATITSRFPIKDGENPDTYRKAVKARTFDSLRGFLPAGITTQLSWHTNLRQAGDHLNWLKYHPSPEISHIADNLRSILHNKYPSSGFDQDLAFVSGESAKNEIARDERIDWIRKVARDYTYPAIPMREDAPFSMQCDVTMRSLLPAYRDIFETRPRGCVLPHFLTDLGQITSAFLLDFGSHRDIQRQRNGVCRMPMLTMEYGFEPWYLEQLDSGLADEAKALIERQEKEIEVLSSDPVLRQYYTALGFRVPTQLTYALPAQVYVMELRAGKMIHPTLRKQIHLMVKEFERIFPEIPLHVDMDPDDWSVRRGLQTITKKD